MVTARLFAVPHPGPVWGNYPERASDRPARDVVARIGGGGSAAQRYRQVASAAGAQAHDWLALPAAQRKARTQQLGGRLAHRGFDRDTVVQALACVAAHAQRALGIEFHPSQLQCGAALLDQRLAEMATGEGKTLAAGLAAGAGALAGIPVHVITANEYLARRDAETLRPLYESLGLTVAAIAETASPQARQQAYRADVVYATARAVAFDYLRDRLVRSPDRSDLEQRLSRRTRPAQGAGPLLMRGLCMAIVDEADSVLIDEAKMPLIISEARPDASERARVWQSLDMARRLSAGVDFETDRAERRVALTVAGRSRIEAIAAEYGPIWLNRGHREELIEQALCALHALVRDVDYLVKDGEVGIIDPISGRSADGRVWSRSLHSAVALKENLEPPPPTDIRARITYPRLFARYHHLCGLSGTLREVRRELKRTYGLSIVAIPLHRPARRRNLPVRVFDARAELFEAAIARAQQVRSSGRPVLLATDSVADSQSIACALAEAGVDHAVLNAHTASEEAAVIADAGQSPRITVATQMAGRGTDIGLSPAVRAAGGLHVLSLQHNRSRRLDRQIAGRAARQGDPGSYERWICLDAPLLARSLLDRVLREFARVGLVRDLLGRLIVAHAQHLAESEDAAHRRFTLRQDKDWSQRLHFATIAE
jgi:preprotein translocase subunit SecA